MIDPKNLAVRGGRMVQDDGTVIDTATMFAEIHQALAVGVATETTLAAILTKLIAAPATEATLAAILAELIAAPATETSLAALLASAGAKAGAAITDPTAAADLIQLGKGLLKQLQGTGSGAAPVLLTGRKLALATGNYNQVLNVAAGGNTIITITPPAGELWRIKSLYIEIPAPTSSTTGTHSVRLYYYTDIADSILEAKSTFNTLIWVSGQLLKSSTSSKFPALDADAQRAILNHVATNAVPLKLRYYNGTDVAQTGTALITVVREVEYIA